MTIHGKIPRTRNGTIWYDSYKLTTRLALGDTTVWTAALGDTMVWTATAWAGEGVMVVTDVVMEEVTGAMEATVAWEWAAEDSKTSSCTGDAGRQYGF